MLLPLLALCSAKHPLAAPPLCMRRQGCQHLLVCALQWRMQRASPRCSHYCYLPLASIIRYDAVTTEGKLEWQNTLNHLNRFGTARGSVAHGQACRQPLPVAADLPTCRQPLAAADCSGAAGSLECVVAFLPALTVPLVLDVLLQDIL